MATKSKWLESESPELFKLGCESSLEVSLEYIEKGKANLGTRISCGIDDNEVRNIIWRTVNRKNFMNNYVKYYVVPDLEKSLKNALKAGVPVVSKSIPIGKNFFARTMIVDNEGIPFSTEPHVMAQLLNTNRQQILRWSRRLAKSWFMKIDMLYHSVFMPGTYSLYLCQSWDVSKEHLEIVQDWVSRNPLLLRFSGGVPSWKLERKISASNIYFMNGSKISCRSATLSRKLSGKSPNRLYEDEKALYSRTSSSEELTILKRGQVEKEKMIHLIASAPAGDGTLFEKLCHDPMLSKFWPKSVLPLCEKITFDEHGTPKFHNILTKRIQAEELLEDWYYLGRDRFMEQYMLLTMSIENRAVPEDVLEGFFDRNISQKYESEKPCIVSYDLGKSAAHKSIIMVGEIQESGDVHIIRIIKLPKGHPIRSRLSRTSPTKKEIKGVIEMVLDLVEPYNVQWVVGDATGMGVDEPFKELKALLYDLGIPSNNVIGYKWSKSSEKFMGKAPLWFNLVLPRMQQGRIKCYYDEDFQWEFMVWQAKPSQTGATTQLKPMKQTYSDDMITTMMQMVYVAFRRNFVKPMKSEKGEGLMARPERKETGYSLYRDRNKDDKERNYEKRRRKARDEAW